MKKGQYLLKFISGKYQGGEFPIELNAEIKIGRNSDLEMVLIEDMVSRRHAMISNIGEDIWVEDIGSANGTFVNGEKIQKQKIKEGDRVLIGTSIIKLVYEEENDINESTLHMELCIPKISKKITIQNNKINKENSNNNPSIFNLPTFIPNEKTNIISMSKSFKDSKSNSEISLDCSIIDFQDIESIISENDIEIDLNIENKILENRFKILGPLGEGGMGSVYLAEDSLLQRKVAIKIANKDFIKQKNIQLVCSNIIAEAQKTAQIKNSSILEIYHLGFFNEIPFIVFEHIDGITLKKYIQTKNRLKSMEALSIAYQICLALKEIHNAGIVHRDLTPFNVMILEHKNYENLDQKTPQLNFFKIKIIDLGISAFKNKQNETIAGSPGYMAPEQMVFQDAPNEKIDIWAIGILIFEMITGRPPKRGLGEDIILDVQSENIQTIMKNIILGCLNLDPYSRIEIISLISLIEILFKDIGFSFDCSLKDDLICNKFKYNQTINQFPIKFGRDLDCEFMFKNNYISGLHLIVYLTWDGEVFLKYLGKNFGKIKQNSQKIKPIMMDSAFKLENETEIFFGKDAGISMCFRNIIHLSDFELSVKKIEQSLSAAFLSSAARAPISRRNPGYTQSVTAASVLTGFIEEIPLPDLLQLFGTSKKNGCLIINTETYEGKIYLRGGRLVGATINDDPEIPMDKGFYRMMSWTTGTFMLDTSTEADFENGLDENVEAMMMEGMRLLDEIRNLGDDLPQMMHHVLLPTPLVPPLRNLTPELLDTLQVAHNYSRIETILNKSLASDLETLQDIVYLIRNEYLRVDEA